MASRLHRSEMAHNIGGSNTEY